MKTYYIGESQLEDFHLLSSEWDKAEKAEIAYFPWDTGGIKPITEARLLYNQKGIFVRFDIEETDILARFSQQNDPVYTDSCVEFFICPNPKESEKYINFEFNANGAMLAGIGTNRFDRQSIEEDMSIFQIETLRKSKSWKLKFFLPFPVLKRYFGVISSNMKGNLYKCAEDNSHPHFGCWNLIEQEKMDFHLPKYFGQFIFKAME